VLYKTADKILTGLDLVRDRLAGQIKGELEAAAFRNTPVPGARVRLQTLACKVLTGRAAHLAQHVP
jgi:hypothetical protein